MVLPRYFAAIVSYCAMSVWSASNYYFHIIADGRVLAQPTQKPDVTRPLTFASKSLRAAEDGRREIIGISSQGYVLFGNVGELLVIGMNDRVMKQKPGAKHLFASATRAFTTRKTTTLI